MVLGSFVFWHDLHVHRPTRKIALGNVFVQVFLMTLSVLAHHLGGLFIGEVLHRLLGSKRKFDPKSFVVRIDEAKGVAPKPVHLTEASRDSTIRVKNQDLV